MFATDRVRLTAITVLALVCGAVLLLPGVPALLSGPAALLLVLVLPGYAVMRALFGRRLEVAEQVLITFAFSVGISIATGLGLNLFPEGLTLERWGEALTGICVVGLGIGALRGSWTHGAEPDALPEATVEPAAGAASALTPAAPADADAVAASASETPAEGTPPGASYFGVRRPQLIMLAAAVVILMAALGVARLGVTAQPHDPFTQFWMIADPSGQTAQAGFTNEEGKQTTYRLLLRVDTKTVMDLTGLVVEQGATWQHELTLPITDADPHSVTALLYRTGDTLPYREAHSTVSLPSPAPGAPGQSAVPGSAAPSAPARASAAPSRTP